MQAKTFKGTYVLLIELTRDKTVIVGKLGKIRFKKGYYAYVGSAMNSLEARIARHLNRQKRIFWHIDYLLKERDICVKKVFVIKNKRVECKLARVLNNTFDCIERFGASDCSCQSHLFRVTSSRFLKVMKKFNATQQCLSDFRCSVR